METKRGHEHHECDNRLTALRLQEIATAIGSGGTENCAILQLITIMTKERTDLSNRFGLALANESETRVQCVQCVLTDMIVAVSGKEKLGSG